jgi:hypothetical protein
VFIQGATHRIASAKHSAMEEAMLHFSRSTSIIGAPLAVAALLACVTPAGALLSANGTSMNMLSANGTNMQGISATAVSQAPANPSITTGSALGDLNGVAVEAIIISEAAIR